MLRSEILKLKRSYVWVVCVVIPVLSVVFGSLNFAQHRDQVGDDWVSYSSQTSLFYALFFFNVGAAIIVSTIWKDDIKHNNWRMLIGCYGQPRMIFAAKALIGAALIIAMQVIFMILTVVAGLVISVDGIDFGNLAADFLLVAVAAFPLAIFQSLISYLTRSFAWPIGICLFLCVSGVAVTTSPALHVLANVIPQALATYAIAAPSSAFEVGSSYGDALFLCVASALVQCVVYLGLTVGMFSRRQRVA